MAEKTDLRLVNYNGFEMLESRTVGVAPYFSNALSHRIHRKLATNIVFTGEPGIGKSYVAITG